MTPRDAFTVRDLVELPLWSRGRRLPVVLCVLIAAVAGWIARGMRP